MTLAAPANAGSYAGCWRLRYWNGYFGDPIWLVVNVDGSMPAHPPAHPLGHVSHDAGLDMSEEQLMQQQLRMQERIDEEAIEEEDDQDGDAEAKELADEAEMDLDALLPPGYLAQRGNED